MYFCLLLIMLVTIIVQGARPKNEFKQYVVRSLPAGECAFTLRKTIYAFSFNKPFESNDHTTHPHGLARICTHGPLLLNGLLIFLNYMQVSFGLYVHLMLRLGKTVF